MLISELDQFYLDKEKPLRDSLLAIRDIILNHDSEITTEWKYKLPFFYHKGKMLCYLWIHKKLKKPYIGICNGFLINHEDLLQEKRTKIKILLLDENKDLPIKKIKTILNLALAARH